MSLPGPDSATRGAVQTVSLTPGVQVFVLKGVCNGFQALEEDTEYLYFLIMNGYQECKVLL